MTDLHVLSKQVLEAFESRGLTLATAESCTGGLIAFEFTRIPGASSVYNGGVVAYANHVKTDILGVDTELIEKCGAVDSNVAVQMACGVRRITGSDYAISTTGIAGPDGGTSEKPVGLVYIGISASDRTIVEKLLLDGDRDMIRNDTAVQALKRLIDVVTADEVSDSN
jgi:PncC family amidohydrolase